MRIKKKSKYGRIRKAIIEDVINYIIGFSRIPVPLKILQELTDIRRESSPSNFVDWQLKDWPMIYYKEWKNCVKIPYKGIEYFLPQVLIFDNTKYNLKLSDIYFHPDRTFFRLRDDIRALTEDSYTKLLNYLRKKKNYTNEQNLRLNKIFKEQKKVILEVQPVEYKYYVHTNLVLDAKSNKKNQTLREYLHSDGKLEDIDKSSLADLLGINILLFTADGSLVMQKRSKRVAFRSGELSASVSGTISYTDIPTTITLKEMPSLREAFEELGIIETDIIEDQIFFLGISRDLIRGGTVDMFLFANTILSERQITKKWKEEARDKWESERIVFFNFGEIAYEDLTSYLNKHKFLSKVDEFIDNYLDILSVPLITNVALWIKYRLSWGKSHA